MPVGIWIERATFGGAQTGKATKIRANGFMWLV
jgi:hypothetical protein